MTTSSDLQRIALVLLRTVIGWHFLYEGYYKLMLPAWSRTGDLIGRFSAAGYLKAASGPFAFIFHQMASPSMLPWIDRVLPIALAAVGLSLMLGLFTQTGGWGALVLLVSFYLAAIPTAGVPQPGAEGTYLLVNKNLIEAIAVGVVIVFHTGEIAGLDLLIRGRRAARHTVPVSAAGGNI